MKNFISCIIIPLCKNFNCKIYMLSYSKNKLHKCLEINVIKIDYENTLSFYPKKCKFT